jgi:nucleoside-diphosphate kinase
MERTLGLIKPDAVKAKFTGRIISRIEEEGFNIVAMKKLTLSKEQAQKFYAIHKERPFFGELVDFMSSGPIIAMVLEKENAIPEWRKLMGATNPDKAEESTLRKLYAKSTGENATHGSDAPETAAVEIPFFFPGLK